MPISLVRTVKEVTENLLTSSGYVLVIPQPPHFGAAAYHPTRLRSDENEISRAQKRHALLFGMGDVTFRAIQGRL